MTTLEEFEKKLAPSIDLEKTDLETMLSGIDGLVQVSPQDGYVKITGDRKLSTRQKIHLAVSARYLVNQLQSKLGRDNPVKPTMTMEELAGILRIDSEDVRKRVSDLKLVHSLNVSNKGEISVTPHSIMELIKELKQKKK